MHFEGSESKIKELQLRVQSLEKEKKDLRREMVKLRTQNLQGDHPLHKYLTAIKAFMIEVGGELGLLY